MSQQTLPEPTQDAVDALNRIARSHFDWTGESFVRVLTLAEWGDRQVSDRIDDEYKREIPRLYRAIERIDELGGRASMHLERDYARHLPDVGKDLAEMLARERESLAGFQLTLGELGEQLSAAGEKTGASIARAASASRTAYLAWIDREASGSAAAGGPPQRRLEPAPPEAAPVWISLKRLYVQLSPAIEETVVHMLLLQRAGESQAARQTWQDSWAYMLYAADVVRLLARRGWQMDFRSSDSLGDLAPPSVASSAEATIPCGERRHESLASALGELDRVLAESGDDEARAIASAIAGYLAARLRGEPGKPPRETPNFEAMLERERFIPAEEN